jgi:hypothetical protein
MNKPYHYYNKAEYSLRESVSAQDARVADSIPTQGEIKKRKKRLYSVS